MDGVKTPFPLGVLITKSDLPIFYRAYKFNEAKRMTFIEACLYFIYLKITHGHLKKLSIMRIKSNSNVN